MASQSGVSVFQYAHSFVNADNGTLTAADAYVIKKIRDRASKNIASQSEV